MTVCVGYGIIKNKIYVLVSDAHTSNYVRKPFDHTTENNFICNITVTQTQT